MTHSVRNTLLVGGVMLAAVAIFFSKQSGKPTGGSLPVIIPSSHKSRSSGITRPTEPQQKLLEPVPSPYSPGSTEDTEWTNARITAIHDLEWFDDAESLRKILAELRSPISEIRIAALDATRAFGSREAIPYLTTLAVETGDPLEQRALTDLIEYLKLPTLIEQLDQKSEE